tara:strand:+ start:59 stop:382 length:324 start_codon:yes stop_codon:yes gene_type:complete
MNTTINQIMKSAVEKITAKNGHSTITKTRNEIMKSSPINFNSFEAKQWAHKMIIEQRQDGFIIMNKVNVPNMSGGNNINCTCIAIQTNETEQKRIFKIFESIRETRK